METEVSLILNGYGQGPFKAQATLVENNVMVTGADLFGTSTDKTFVVEFPNGGVARAKLIGVYHHNDFDSAYKIAFL